MSFADRVKNGMTVFAETHSNRESVGHIDTDTEETSVLPALEKMVTNRLVDAIRVSYRQRAGLPPCADIRELSRSTAEDLVPSLSHVLTVALCCGMEVGMGTHYQVKRHKKQDIQDDLFTHKSFLRDVGLQAVTLTSDEEYREFVHEALKGSMWTLATLSGYAETENPDDMVKVWDLWLVSSRSLAMSLYMVGLSLGAQDIEAATLSGILDATEKKEEIND